MPIKVLCLYFGEGNGNPLQYSCLENAMDGGAWKAAVHGVAEDWTQLNDFTLTFHFHSLEKEMAAHSSVLAWRIPGMGEPTRETQEYWSGQPIPSSGDLPSSGMQPELPALQADSLPTELSGKPILY